MVNSVLIDFVNRLNSASKSRLVFIDVKVTVQVFSIILLLLKYGVIKKYKLLNISERKYRIYLSYRINGSPVFKSIKLIKKPSVRVNFTLSRLDKVKNDSLDFHIIFLSTPQGILSDLECVRKNCGGVPILGISLM